MTLLNVTDKSAFKWCRKAQEVISIHFSMIAPIRLLGLIPHKINIKKNGKQMLPLQIWYSYAIINQMSSGPSKACILFLRKVLANEKLFSVITLSLYQILN
jgi:hypothetical protein